MKSFWVILAITHMVVTHKSYFIPNLKANWFRAYEFCLSIDRRLATIESKEESDAIIQFIKDSDKYGSRIRFWIGAGDLAKEGKFTWTATNKLVTYSIWGTNEPNNRDGDENCVEIFHVQQSDYWIWNDHVCEYELFFICESLDTACDLSTSEGIDQESVTIFQ